MKRLTVGIAMIAVLSLCLGCSGGTERMAKEELDKYSMKSYREGNERLKSQGTTLNSAFLSSLKETCARRGIKLTHETYSEGLDGNISYSYFINGDARHFLMVHVFPNKAERIRKMDEIYGLASNGAGADDTGASVISSLDNTALVYASSGQKRNQFKDEMREVFEEVLDGMRIR